MRFSHFLPRLVCLAFLLTALSGCQAFQSYRPVQVKAQDAETGQPIPGAIVHITYPGAQPAFSPWESTAITGPDGIAHLQAAPYGDFGIDLALEKKGYLSEEKTIPIKNVAAIQPAHWFEAVERRPADFVMAAYAGPGPKIELLVPAGYRGPVQAEVLPSEDFHGQPGERCFRAEVSSSGAAQVIGPLLLKQIFSADFTLKYADGLPLSWNAKETDVGFWWLKSEGRVYYFFVGTADEYRAQHGHTQRSVGDAPGDKQGGGRGKRGRGGMGSS